MEEETHLPLKFQQHVCRGKGSHNIWGRRRFRHHNNAAIRFGGVTLKKMMQHIHNKRCIKMTLLDKANKKNGHNNPWDTTTDINIYWKYLDDLTKKLEARDIATSSNEKVSVSVAQMRESNYFTEESLIKW